MPELIAIPLMILLLLTLLVVERALRRPTKTPKPLWKWDPAHETAWKDLSGPLVEYGEWNRTARERMDIRDRWPEDVVSWASESIDLLTKDPRISNWRKEFEKYSTILPGFMGVVELIQHRQELLRLLSLRILEGSLAPGEGYARAYKRLESCLWQQIRSIDQVRFFLEYYCRKESVAKPGPFPEGICDDVEMDTSGNLAMPLHGGVFPAKTRIEGDDLISFLDSQKA